MKRRGREVKETEINHKIQSLKCSTTWDEKRIEGREEFIGEQSSQMVNKHTTCLRFRKARQISVS